MKKRIQSILKKLNFQTVIAGIVVLLVVFMVIYAIFDRPVLLPGTSLDNVPGVNQPASYEVKQSTIEGEPELVTVYVDDLDSLTDEQIRLLINAALQRAGKNRDSVRISLNEYNDVLPGEGEDDPAPTTGNYVDPTDPDSYVSYGNDGADNTAHVEDEPLVGYTFDKYVTQLKPRTTYYEIYKTGENQYLVVLKGGYTRTEFDTEVLSKFADAINANIEYEDRINQRQ